MTNDEFILTLKLDDLREIYRDKLNYQFISKDNFPAIILTAFFLVLSIISISKTISNDAFFFLSLCFIFGLGYQITQILKHYWQFKKGTEEIEKWLDSLKKYNSHSIQFGDSFFKYLRDKEIFVYDINSVKKTYRTADHFYFMTTDNIDIILPKKSFQAGEFERFLSCFDERTK